MKFKTELEKDKSILDLKEHECKKNKIKVGNLFKEKKEVQQKMEAPGLCFFVLQVELDSPMPPIGLESPSHSIRQPTFFYASMPPFNAGGFGKDGRPAEEAQTCEV